MQIGLSYSEALDIPFGELKTFIAIEQIKHEGAKEKRPEETFWEILERK